MTPSKDPRRYVFRYDEHMPDVDDVSMIVLKGHLLIEEMLLEFATLALEHPKHLAKLSFHQLACLVRALMAEKPDDKCWEMILQINSLRNCLAHKLQPPDLDKRIKRILALDKELQQIDDIILDKSREDFEQAEGLRHAIVSCMLFLRGLIYNAEAKVRTHNPGADRQ
jgi:hypothetical protein